MNAGEKIPRQHDDGMGKPRGGEWSSSAFAVNEGLKTADVDGSQEI